MGILFVCEPLSEHGLAQYGDALHWGYTEHDALQYFLKNIKAISGTSIPRVVVRPHPSEFSGKYDWVKHENPSFVIIGGKETLLDEVAQCDVVVGCESMAMVVGLIAGKRVISCIPPGGNACSLPHSEIENLSAIIGDYKANEQTL